jgi:general secretion pathway protein K
MALMIIAAELARTMHVEGLTAESYQQVVITYDLALAGFHRALYQFVRAPHRGRPLLAPPGTGAPVPPNAQLDRWARGDGQWYNEAFGAGGYWVRVTDEGGKLNLNQVDEAALRQALANLGFALEFTETLADAILDWRDADSLVRLHGAESDRYLALPVPYPAKDGPFDTLAELLLVRGVTPALFYGRNGGPALRELFTVYHAVSGGTGTVNLLTAGPLVLQAVLGVDAARAQELVRQRAETGIADLASLPPGSTGGVFDVLPSVVTIESIGYLQTGGVTRRLAGVVQRQDDTGFRVLHWQDHQEETGPLLP